MKIKRIRLEKLKNTRDLKGFKSSDNTTVKEKALIRSGHLAQATENDIKVLIENYNLKTVIDLRTDAEIGEKPEKLPDCINYMRVPLLDNSFLGIARDEYSVRAWFNLFKDKTKKPTDIFGEMYDALVFGERAKILIPQIFDVLLSENDGAVLWHCSAGKDRVGIVTLLILTALGVDRETIVKDYMATNRFSAKEIILTRLFSPFVLKDMHLVRCLAVLMGVKRIYVDRIFQRIDSDYDNVADFFEKQYGITSEMLPALKNKYLA